MQTTELFDGQRNSADVIIIDGLAPQEGAMSQALYSRKPKSILFHLNSVFKKGGAKFMETYYSKYGHNSIGDCGSTTLYFENVSMLTAKAIQNWSLYNGQEASTRYLDFSGRIMINPLAGDLQAQYLYIPKTELTSENIEGIDKNFKTSYQEALYPENGAIGRMIQEKWMGFYQKHMPKVKMHVAELNPRSEDQDESDYDKAINARAFDIMRSFIPAGMTTLVSWHSNIRQLRDHLAILKYHPSREIGRIARTAIDGLRFAYPASFLEKEYDLNDPKQAERAQQQQDVENYLSLRAQETSYFDHFQSKDIEILDDKFQAHYLCNNYYGLLSTRPNKTEVPPEVGDAGVVNVRFKIDFGSFRDAQRHRKGSYKMPLLTTDYGFHPWYLERLPGESRIEAEALIEELVQIIKALPCTEVERQYYIPMGFIVPADFTWPFDQCVYVAELRSSETVHPTFRVHAQAIGKWIEKVAPYATLYVDYSPDKWSFKRGKQDIVEKKV